MEGNIRGTGERVTFTYEQGMTTDNYTAQIDGEVFTGKAVMDGATSITGQVFDLNTNSALDNPFGTQVFGTSTTNKFVAVMIGNRGSSLNCQMRYADPSGFTPLGGVGICAHSDGRIIDGVW